VKSHDAVATNFVAIFVPCGLRVRRISAAHFSDHFTSRSCPITVNESILPLTEVVACLPCCTAGPLGAQVSINAGTG